MAQVEDKDKTLNFVDLDGNVYIMGEFDDTIYQNVIPQIYKRIKELANVATPVITVFIDSPGGSANTLFSLLALLDMAKQHGIVIETIVTGFAGSCASLLACYGDIRKMYRYATNLMHLGMYEDGCSTFKQLERFNKNSKEHFNTIVSIYKEHSKMPENKIIEELKDDGYILNAKECLKYGLIDEII